MYPFGGLTVQIIHSPKKGEFKYTIINFGESAEVILQTNNWLTFFNKLSEIIPNL